MVSPQSWENDCLFLKSRFVSWISSTAEKISSQPMDEDKRGSSRASSAQLACTPDPGEGEQGKPTDQLIFIYLDLVASLVLGDVD